jgi:hypothetical protein
MIHSDVLSFPCSALGDFLDKKKLHAYDNWMNEKKVGCAWDDTEGALRSLSIIT